MKSKLFIYAFAFLFTSSLFVKADEGMWLPLLLGKNYDDMQRLGLKLTKEQLYDINNSSLKDAIVMLDHGNCTGEMISSEGLLLTNHHCAFDDVQSHSSVEHDYLTDGFWAMTRADELPNNGKSASFLVRVEDVTARVLTGITDETSAADRKSAIGKAIKEIEKEATAENNYEALVQSMLSGNEFYLFVYETYNDVRLVGAPPSSIGKFGGDTDNWVWPRHTGDFSMYRVYMSPDGKPAEYSKDNVPFKPKHHLPVSLKGVQENDFAMIWGYPGTTERYLPSAGIDLKIKQTNPACVKLRDTKMKIMHEDMSTNDKVRIQYAAKYAFLGNFWKKDKEQIKALLKLKVVEQKKELEDQFEKWANENPEKQKKYGAVIKDINDSYKEIADNKYELAYWYFVELTFMNGAEIMTFSLNAYQLEEILKSQGDATQTIADLKKASEKHYKDYNAKTDMKIMAAMLDAYYKDVPAEFHPEELTEIYKKYKGDFSKYTDVVFAKSIFADEAKLNAFLEKPSAKVLGSDPALSIMKAFYKTFMKINMAKGQADQKLNKAERLFIAGLREMHPDKNFYPDANSTMRCTYGKVMPYDPADAVEYDFRTYLDGVMEKEDPSNEEFIVSPKLKELFKAKDFGQYGVDGRMPVGFITNNDITGGNSGSPVINANGEIIGTAFDGNSEAMSSDIEFDDNLQRTIVCDIRYVLFVIDKYAGAKHLIDEMDLVK
ncbi:MAG TPA: serine protease [Bacteroidales bacterium]|nr:MAG: peptidase S46 [Bacteroidetes bacterium GWF2_33_38]OFY91925.1 MAG: peptidase S46 [Bacteroidetes bacterium RIFOXYA2_FULL_33_7]HBF87053.1 serine protease [Bacteroidales bacterium]